MLGRKQTIGFNSAKHTLKHNSMKIIQLILLFFLIISKSFAGYSYQKTQDSILVKTIYYDSLFTSQKYEKIIEECRTNKVKTFNKLSGDNLIAAYFFNKDTLKAQQIIKNKLSQYEDAYGATELFISNSLGYLNFLSVDTNWNFILYRVLNMQKNEGITDLVNAKKILILYIQDPHLRNLRKKGEEQYKSILGMDIDREKIVDSLVVLNKKVYQFYNSTNKLFSKIEVGSIYRIQKIFLIHDAQEREKGYFKNNHFYKVLLDDAIKKDIFDKDYAITYAILTEVINNIGLEGYFQNKTEILAKYRKLYNSPDYEFRPV